jgi:CDP-paratose 2-epimerase
VLRQSCICGPGQISSEEQGWVAWMMIAHAIGKPIRIFGDGKQVRDILHVDDLIGLFECLLQNTSIASGKIYNVGGGTDNTLSLMELLEFLRRRSGREVEYCFGEARPLDQRYFVSNTRLVQRELQWRPRITRNAILDEMWNWVSTHNDVLAQLYR